MGAVYKAEDTQFGNRLVAVKEMSQSALSQQDAAQAADAFKEEALILARLKHPSLPSIYDHFTEANRWYLVMDFIEGESLDEYLDKAPGKKLKPDEALNIGIQLCTVLDYLHRQKPQIIFRDLKPSNVMLTPDGHVYLIDFGIARLFKPGQAKDTNAYGSMGYSPPEQFGKAQTTPQSDIYSLGVTLHQMLSGNDPSYMPFRFAPLNFPGQPAISRLTTLIMQMLDADPTKRPATMAAVRQILEQTRDEMRLTGSLPPMQRAIPPTQSAIPPRVASLPPQLASLAPRVVTSSANVWSIGRRQVVAMIAGIALYAATSVIQLPSTDNVTLRPAIVIPLFFGAVFGPWVGLFVGGVGNVISDLISYHNFYWNWDVGNALIGFIAGLAMLYTYGRYRSIRPIVIAEIFSAVGIVVGIGFAAYNDIWFSNISFTTATVGELIPAGISYLIIGLILLPILLVTYSALIGSRGRP
jgi:uncharacterized membrane protein